MRIRRCIPDRETICTSSPVSAFDFSSFLFASTERVWVFLAGLGLGAILARAISVTDTMVEASSLGLAGSLDDEEEAHELLYPCIERIRDISAIIAAKVIRAAQTAVSPPPSLFFFSEGADGDGECVERRSGAGSEELDR
jgi:malic enzyme